MDLVLIAVAKYCDEHAVCVCVCVLAFFLSARIFREPHARSLPIFVHVAYGGGSVLLRQGDEIPRGRGSILGVFFPIDNALYSRAFRSHTKTAEPIEMPFVMMSRLGPRNVCYVGMTIPDGEGAVLTSPTPLRIANWTGPCSDVHMTGTDV